MDDVLVEFLNFIFSPRLLAFTCFPALSYTEIKSPAFKVMSYKFLVRKYPSIESAFRFLPSPVQRPVTRSSSLIYMRPTLPPLTDSSILKMCSILSVVDCSKDSTLSVSSLILSSAPFT